MAQHTPGDWTFNPKTGDISAPDGQTVGYAASHRREREANGQLFAVAPKLLAALKRLRLAAFDYFPAEGEAFEAMEAAQAALVAAGEPESLDAEEEWTRWVAKAESRS